MTTPNSSNQTTPPFDLTSFFKPPQSPNPHNNNTSHFPPDNQNNSLLPPPLPYPTPPSSSYPPPTQQYYQNTPNLPNPSNSHLLRSVSYPIPPLQPPPNSGARLMALLTTPPPNHDLPPVPFAQPGILRLPNSTTSNNINPQAGILRLPISVNTNTLLSKGRHLVGDNVSYDIDVRLQGEVEPPQLEVSPITKYISDPHLVVGRQIAVNGTYICYGLKMGNIRVLDINTALRSLLKGHTARVSDMAFFAEDVHLLASASLNGRFYVWNLSEGQDQEDKPQIIEKLVTAIQVVGEGVATHPRVCWHCHKQEILVIGMGAHILRLDTTKVGKGEVYSAEDPLKFTVEKPINGVQYVGKHDGEVTDLSMCQWMTTRLVSASTDGMIKIWEDHKAAPATVLRPHDGHPVNSARFLTSPNQPDHIILMTGGPLNQEVKFWASASDEGWLRPTDAQEWKCIQTLKLKSSDESQVEEVFFNQVVVLSQPGLLLLANAKKNAIYAVHFKYGPYPTATRMDYIAEFTVTMPILSFTGTSILLPNGEQIVKLYCVQTQAIQQYALNLLQCLPPPLENAGLGKSGSGISFEVSSAEGLTAVEPSASKPIETVLASSTTKPTTLEIISDGSPGVKLPVNLTCTDSASMHESTSSYIMEPGTSDINTNYVATPPIPLSPKLSGRLSGFSIFSNSSDSGLHLNDHGADQHLIDNSVDRQIDNGLAGLSDSRKKDKNVIQDDIGSVIDAPAMFKHPTHLITPSEILMAASSLENTSIVGDKSEGKANTQDVVVNKDVGHKEAEVKVVEETSSVQNNGSGTDTHDAVTERGIKEKFFCSQASDIGVQMATDSSKISGETYMVENRQVDGAYSTESLNEPPNAYEKEILDSTKQVSGKAAGTSRVSNLDSSNVPAASSNPSDTVFPQIVHMQEMLKQSMVMQKEMQKQISMMAAVPITKEGRRLESALGRSMDKAVKTNADALWARLQEENAKNENLLRDRTQQITSLITSIVNKDLPAMVEKTVKKELNLVGPTVARAIIPVVEKTVSAAIVESFQRGVGDKAVNQLEKSMNSKLEASVARQMHAQFQTSGKQALQDSLKSVMEATMIPAFELSCKAMFEQIDSTFQKGMVEHTAAAQKQFESTHSTLALSLRDAVSSALSVAQTLSGELSDGHRKLLALAGARADPNAVNPLVTQLSNGSLGGLHEKVEVPFDPRIELSRFISEHKYEEAFSAALQRSDVSIVSWLCDQVDLQRILSIAPPPLSQRVLLFLLQQLACDLQKDTPRKLGWMTDIAVAINPADPTIALHLRPIFEQVYQILNHHCNLPTVTGAELTSIRIVLHVINSMLLTHK